MTKSKSGMKGLFHLVAVVVSTLKVREGTEGKTLEAGSADAEAKKECCLVTCSSWFP